MQVVPEYNSNSIS